MPNPPSNENAQLLREIVAAAVSLAIAVIVLWMLCSVFNTAGADLGDKGSAKLDGYTRQKDLLTVGLGLLGAVTGYYFGRVPAELRARQARQTAEKAEGKLTTVENRLTASEKEAANAATTKDAAERERDTAKAETKKIQTKTKAVLAPVKKLVAKARTGQRATLSGDPKEMADAKEIDDLDQQIDSLMNELG